MNNRINQPGIWLSGLLLLGASATTALASAPQTAPVTMLDRVVVTGSNYAPLMQPDSAPPRPRNWLPILSC